MVMTSCLIPPTFGLLRARDREEMVGGRLPSCLALVVLLYCVLEYSCDGIAVSELCARCPGAVRNGSIVMEGCGDGGIVERCCVRRQCSDCSATVIGLDWSHCNLTELTDYMFTDVQDTLQILDVSENELMNESISSRTLGGLTNLSTLVLPLGVECDASAWNGSAVADNATICYYPKQNCEPHVIGPWPNITDVVDWINITNSNSTVPIICPDNSDCVPDGPGLHQCLCSKGYHGYKCLLQGTFPYAAFFATSVGGTVVAVAIYWSLRLSEKLLGRRRVLTVTANHN